MEKFKKFYVRVINTGKGVRERLGSRFLPGKEQEVYVNQRQFIALKAVRDFEVTKITKNDTGNAENDTNKAEDDTGKAEKDPVDDKKDPNDVQDTLDMQKKINDSTVEEVVNLVLDGQVKIDEAIGYEVVGKNRATLIKTLEEMN